MLKYNKESKVYLSKLKTKSLAKSLLKKHKHEKEETENTLNDNTRILNTSSKSTIYHKNKTISLVEKKWVLAFYEVSANKDFAAFVYDEYESDKNLIVVLDLVSGKVIKKIKNLFFVDLIIIGTKIYYTGRKGNKYQEYQKINVYSYDIIDKKETIVKNIPKIPNAGICVMRSMGDNILFTFKSHCFESIFYIYDFEEFKKLDINPDSAISILGFYHQKIIATYQDKNSPNGKVISLDKNGKINTLIKQTKEVIIGAEMEDYYMAINYLGKDMKNKVHIFERFERKQIIEFEEYGSIDSMDFDKELYIEFSSPLTKFLEYKVNLNNYAIKCKKNIKAKNYQNLEINLLDVKGIPVFEIKKKKLKGKNPSILYTYGGFNDINIPYYSSLCASLVDQDFAYYIACLPGGGEKGFNYHLKGRNENKMNTISAHHEVASYLKKYKSSKLISHGASNGGFVTALSMNLKPELYDACVPHVGVYDLQNYHKYTAGRLWQMEYGLNKKHLKSIDCITTVPKQIPPTYLLTAQQDFRVAPAHSIKYYNALKGKGDVILEIKKNSSHGCGADQDCLINYLSFMLYHGKAKK